MKKLLFGFVLSVSLVVSSIAFAQDGRYEVIERDGSYIVSKDGGKTQAQFPDGGGTTNDRAVAEAFAKKLNKKADKNEEK